MKKLLAAALISTTLISLSSADSAKAAFGGYLATSDGKINAIDLTTLVATPLLDTGLGGSIGDVASGGDSNTLYVNTVSKRGGNDSVYRVNLSAGTTTLVGSAGVANLSGLTGIIGKGTVYGSSSAADPANPTPGGGLYSIDTTTGAATQIGSNIPGFSTAGDLTYFPSANKFYATSTSPTNSSLFSIDLSGAGTSIGSIGFANIFGLVRSGSTLYGFTEGGQAITINTTTGVGTSVGNVTGLSGRVLGGAAAVPVPEPQTALGTVAALGLGLVTGLKRKSKST